MAILFAALGLAASSGCQRSPSQVAPAAPPVLPVSAPVQREVTDYVDFTGRTDAVEAVDIRPRVTGYLTKMPFKEGAEVKTGDLLFEIDPRPYQAQLDQAEGQVKLNEASLKLMRVTYQRDRSVFTSVPGGVSQQQLDQDLAAVDEAAARLKAAQSSTEVYKLNLEFTKVTSPIDGMVSRYYYTRGNLVNQDQTLLTTIVSLDPMYVYFDMDEPTLLRVRRAINEGRIKLPQDGTMPVYMGLQGEDGFPHRGTINFANNQVNPATGSIAVRGVFPNPKPTSGERLLSPGMFVRVRLPIGQPHQALLVIDRAIGSDQGLKFVYVLDADNKVQYRRVTVGALQADGLRVIAQGLKADDRVLVGGLQQVRPNMQIQPEPKAMPTLGQAGETGVSPVAPPGKSPVPPKDTQHTGGKEARSSNAGRQPKR
jgi:multidrug efflux system membrane fusion protein